MFAQKCEWVNSTAFPNKSMYAKWANIFVSVDIVEEKERNLEWY